MLLGDNAKIAMQKGANALADIVKVTLGPRGRNIAIDKAYGDPIVTNDGISIAKAVKLECPVENMGARLLRGAAAKTNSVGGDGTTSATVLAQAMINDGIKNVISGINPILLRRGMDLALKDAIDIINNITSPVNSKEDIIEIATISAGDRYIGELIANAIDIVGHEGVVTIEESTSMDTILETTKGLKIERGYVSPYMVTNPDKMEAVLEEAYVLVIDGKITELNSLLPIIEDISKIQGKLLIIADDISDEPLSTIVVNKLRGSFNCVVIKSPMYQGNNVNEYLNDIATVTGAQVISEKLGYDLSDVTVDMLGRAGKIVATEKTTIIVDGYGDSNEINSSIDKIRGLIDKEEDERFKEILKNRLGKLLGGVAVIKVGAATEVAMKELALRIEDSVNATKAAIEEGIVPGGGTSYILARKSIKTKSKIREEQVGIDIVKRALEVPLWQIATNAGEKGDSVVAKVKTLKDGYGFDALECKYRNMLQAGIVDPVKVTKAALINATSVASSFITTEGVIELDDNRKQ